MISRYTYGTMSWVDLESPSREELLHIGEEFNLAKELEEELFFPLSAAKVVPYDTVVYIALHFPEAIGFIIGKNFIITVRHQPIESVQHFVRLFEKHEALGHTERVLDSGRVFMEMMEKLYGHLQKELSKITAHIPQIEKTILADKEKIAIQMAADIDLQLLHFKEVIHSHGTLLDLYETTSKKLFGDSYEHYAKTIMTEYTKLVDALEDHYAVVKKLQQTHHSLLLATAKKTHRTLIILLIITVIIALLITAKFII